MDASNIEAVKRYHLARLEEVQALEMVTGETARHQRLQDEMKKEEAAAQDRIKRAVEAAEKAEADRREIDAENSRRRFERDELVKEIEQLKEANEKLKSARGEMLTRLGITV